MMQIPKVRNQHKHEETKVKDHRNHNQLKTSLLQNPTKSSSIVLTQQPHLANTSPLFSPHRPISSSPGSSNPSAVCFCFVHVCLPFAEMRRLSGGCHSFHDADPVIQVDSDAMFIARHGLSLVMVVVKEGEASVWQRNILMGGKCQLPDFSGVIIYDSVEMLSLMPKLLVQP
ncbi:hypothetical protein CK203_081641 [Vitis vinifera]|uniref:Uncharacterized protein n=1 Tax=Vitis vinifera TaxID=29760 RepID=A0A438DPJ4_VITVI|nr:hypothetical protein CK203_081641 [Vitis vinifera]